MADPIEITQEPRGIKRKASDSISTALPPRRIQALDPDVINKIAAGEIIVAPVHALKELIENSVDAGSTSLEVISKEGGLKFLQITDNGHGISKEDLPILCERFTTSKLKTFDDLNSIGTYGFRGEALASISHIAHLTVTTRTKDSNCAYRATYQSGRLAPTKPGQSTEPKPVAGRHGTQITVEDLFYNVPTRRRAFRSASEEYNKIIDVVSRYAVHCNGVAFSCKKFGEANTSIAIQSNSSTIIRLRQIYGSNVANELIEFESIDDNLGFQARGWTSSANYHSKKITLLLFINNRSVESTNMRKAIEQMYTMIIPKGGHPFVYLSLELEPHRVDVNVHPTKREVNFLNEDEVIEKICNDIRAKLTVFDSSRTFKVQSLLSTSSSEHTPADITEPEPLKGTKLSTQRPRIYENNLVRTDSKLRKITSMLSSNIENEIGTSEYVEGSSNHQKTSNREPVICRLVTIKELRAEVRKEMQTNLTEIFASHTFVGVVDEHRRIAAIQGGVRLFLVDYGAVCNEYFYQVGLSDFGNFGVIRFDPPLNLSELLILAAESEKKRAPTTTIGDGFDVKEVVETVRTQLINRREMLLEYFSLEISAEGELLSMPLLLKGYTPSLAKLPSFLLRLGPYVNWTSEKECFSSFLHELACYYSPEMLPPSSELTSTAASTSEIGIRREQINNAVENVLFPAFKMRLVATKALNGAVIEVANLKGLYKVFERC
ncbi:BgTH12-07943 [Blumeria graminis f. sp. triticale]|uniref:BgTH12-07943 n=3 Tax=Blumeria graminis TaxID=34373 RepID=A0A9W4GFF9_BLUGR|nr:BgTH12-07943 [Blumeria graminis f. sp. triticale]